MVDIVLLNRLLPQSIDRFSCSVFCETQLTKISPSLTSNRQLRQLPKFVVWNWPITPPPYLIKWQQEREENIGNVILSDQNAPHPWKHLNVVLWIKLIESTDFWIEYLWYCDCKDVGMNSSHGEAVSVIDIDLKSIIVIITSIVNMGTQHNNTPTWALAFFQNLSPCFCWWTLVWCECVHFLMCLGTLSVHYALITDNVWFFLSEHVITLALHFKFHRGWLFLKAL